MTDSPIDIEALRRLRKMTGGSDGPLKELIALFVRITPDAVRDMRAARAAEDWGAVRLSAHSMKSNAHDMGAAMLATLCAELELQCKSGAPSNPDGQLTAIDAALNEARTALEHLEIGDV